MSCAINDVWAPPPVLEVIELSQTCKGLARQRSDDIQTLLHAMALVVSLLNTILNVVFFTKDVQTRYLVAGMTLTRRCGFKTVVSPLDKTSADVFPSALGLGYTEQDIRALHEKVTLRDQLEMHLYNGREHGWYLIQELMLRDVQGQVIGMAEISHDLRKTQARHLAWQQLVIVDDHAHNHHHRPIVVEELAVLSGVSVAQTERYCRCIFHLTPRQVIHKVRPEKAIELLAGGALITDTALQRGYADHSMFSHQFRVMMGSAPRDFRITLAGQDTFTVLISLSGRKKTTEQSVV